MRRSLLVPYGRQLSRAGFRAWLASSTLLSPSAALAADYFVATTGSDNNVGSESQPFRTVRRAAEVAIAPGDTVYIRGGVYGGGWDAHLSPQGSGTAGNPITFKAYPGELPILDGSELGEDGSGVEPTEVVVSYVRVEGLVARNFPDSGFSNGWNHSSSNMEFIHCIADGNGVNGIGFNKASNVHIERSITLHNGDRDPSWSSGVSLFEAQGTNTVYGNVSFENIDISSNRSDGSGFILDEGSAGAEFVNNVAFLNGGSCIRLTRSGNGKIVNNTCFKNGQDANVSYNDEFYVSDAASVQGATFVNNVIWPGKAAFGGQAVASTNNNVTLSSGEVFLSSSGALDLHLATSATSLIDQGTSAGAPSDDIGFDFKCLKQQAGLAHWWQYAMNYDYVEAVGGVAGCFQPGARSGPVDVGAYESGAAAAGCASDSECDDGNKCTTDTCGAGARCTQVPIEGCCLSDADCADDDECTLDLCKVAAGTCSNAVDPMCGENASGQWTFDDETGYVEVCDWRGYRWSAAGPSAAGVNETTSSIGESGTGPLCYAGTVAAQDNYGGYAMIGVNINQATGTDTEASNTTLTGDGLNISVTNTYATPLRVQLQDAPDADGNSRTWCVELEGAGGFFPWSEFNTTCWAPAEGEAYAMQPVNVIAVMVAGHNEDDRAFEVCLNQLSPSGAECTPRTTPADDPSDSAPSEDASDPLQAGADDGTTAGASGQGGGDAVSPGALAASGGGGEAAMATTCQAGLALCGTSCVDTTSDPQNCGDCGLTCQGAEVCSQGGCATQCAPGQLQCGQACADTQTNVLNCGACGKACSAGQTCASGICEGLVTGGTLSAPVPAQDGQATPPSAPTTQSGGCSTGHGPSGDSGLSLTALVCAIALSRRRQHTPSRPPAG